MKREIKFRLWDSKIHEWSTKGKDGLVENIIYYNDWDLFDPCDYVFCQYTGLRDKNGREIYEGDIVMWGDTVGLGHEKPVRVAVVIFDPDICFDSNVGIFDYGNFAYKETDKYLTVIGNVYANPELLEAEK